MDDRQRIIDAFEAGEDFLAIATALNIKRSSAYSIVRTYQNGKGWNTAD